MSSADFDNYILLSYHHIEKCHEIEVFENAGGYEALKSILSKPPQKIRETIEGSGLRERGKGGINISSLWEEFSQSKTSVKYLICDAYENSAGSFKDRYMLEKCPHLLIEGMLIASYALGIDRAYICLASKYSKEAKLLEKALEEAKDKNYIGKGIFGSNHNIEIKLHLGPSLEILKERSAFISALEGGKSIPRENAEPAYKIGLYEKPTLIHYFETLCNLPWIAKHGASRFRKFGTEKSPGTKLVSISGDVNRAGVYEIPFGSSVMNLINECGQGIQKGKDLKGILFGNAKNGIFNKGVVSNLKLTYEDCTARGIDLDAGSIIVLNDSRKINDVLFWLSEHAESESCGKCTPCREGTGWLKKILSEKKWQDKINKDSSILYKISEQIEHSSLCDYPRDIRISYDICMKNFKDEIL